MTTDNTISVPGILPSLLEEAKKMRDRQAEKFDRKIDPQSSSVSRFIV